MSNSEIINKKLQGFQLIAQEKLQAVLCSIPGRKNLVLEQALIKQLEFICSASWLKIKGINKIYKFDDNFPSIPLNCDASGSNDVVHVFMLRSNLVTFHKVLQHLIELKVHALNPDLIAIKRFHLICVPRCLAHFHTMLEKHGLCGVVQLHHFNWDFIQIDESLLSLEMPNVFPSVFMRQDYSPLPSIAQSLRILQMICGQMELVLSYGEHSENILKMVTNLGPFPHSQSQASFGALIIIDRDKDYASSLLTPSIYAGLLMEVFSCNAGEIVLTSEHNKIRKQKLDIFEIPSENKTKEAEAKPQRIQLNSTTDEIYGENRYKHFTEASSLIRSQAKAIGLEVQKLNDMKLNEIHDYVARKLPKIAELKSKILRHLKASEIVIEMLAGNFRKLQNLEQDILNNVSRKRLLNEIEELLATDGQRYNILRLMCLLHLCAGISSTSDELTQFMRNYCNVFGHHCLPMFHRLAAANLLPPLSAADKLNKSANKLLSNLSITKFSQTDFQAEANRLKLLVTDGSSSPNLASATCPSYVFNNLYIPLVAQLCSNILKSNNGEDFLNKMGMIEKIKLHVPYAKPGSSMANTGNYSSYNLKDYASHLKQTGSENCAFPIKQRNILVYVVGGATYAEVGACNFLSKLLGAHIVVASDAIVSASDLLAGAEVL